MVETVLNLPENDDPLNAYPVARPKANILIVDDIPDKRFVYKTILEELDQNLFLVGSGEEALRLVLKHDFAVILLDVNMPGMDGFETAAMIRSRRKSAHTPIIFLTAFNDEMMMAQGYATGAVDYLPTPVVPEVLKTKIRVFIELSQMRESAAIQAEERALRTAAEESHRRKDKFLAMLAHELRNPLGPILNGVHLLQMMLPEDERLQSLRELVERQVNHMVRLVDDLLDTTRLARGLILLQKENCDLGVIVKNITDDYRNIFESKGLNLTVDIPENPVRMDGDQTRLTQVIGNLLHNAHKFTPPGGTVTVTLSVDDEGKACSITVKDTGVGIEPHMVAHVFEVFQQGEQGLDRSCGGLGLGLALVKGLVELHDGQVSVESSAQQGAVFKIHLPVGVADTADIFEPSPVFIPRKSASRIVVVEDGRDTAETIKQLLSHDGYEVRVAHSGADGLQVARAFKPDIILCDIGLPGMDGYQFAREVRADSGVASTYMIALSGYGRAEDQQRSLESGFDMHLTKPVNYRSLCNAFEKIPGKAVA